MSIFNSKKKRIIQRISSLMVSALMCCQLTGIICQIPAHAALSGNSVIDTSRTGTLVIHKIIENDGSLMNADGIAVENDYIPVSNVGFDYVRIADFETVSGIVVSRNGAVDLESSGGVTSVGNYFRADECLAELFEAAGEIPKATYIKVSVTDPGHATLQQEFDADRSAHLLQAEQEQVNAAEADLEEASDRLSAARKAYSEGVSASLSAASASAHADNALQKAIAARDEAQQAYEDASRCMQQEADAFNAATIAYSKAQTQLSEAQTVFEDAKGRYMGGDDGTQQRLADAQKAYYEASIAVREASEQKTAAAAKAGSAASVLADAQESLTAAEDILEQVRALNAQTGTDISETGAANALKYALEQYEHASTYYEQALAASTEADEALAAAEDALSEAQERLSDASSALNEVCAADTAAYEAYADALKKLNLAVSALADALAAQNELSESQQAASSRLSAATAALDSAREAASEAQEAYDRDVSLQNGQDVDTESLREAKESAEQAYVAAQNAYNEAVSVLDSTAAAHGITKVYMTEELERAMQEIITTLGEERINKWVCEHAPTVRPNTLSTMGEESEGYTDDRGIVCFSGLQLGLYMVSETDMSYHDGYAGAWNDQESGSINNSETNHYDGSGYHIQPVDGWDQETVHSYQAGDVYRESVNPECPVLESPAAPFLVSLPTTNTTDTNGMTAAGDNEGAAGTVWQYTVDVYPKNQTTGIYKRIVDPDEKSGTETLRTSEDYQIGDRIEQVIWADAPVLQKNYLFDTSDEGFGDGVRGDLADREDLSSSVNEHLGYVISDTMTRGLTFDRVTSVSIIPARALSGYQGKIPQSVDAFDIVRDAADDEGEELIEEEDYIVVNTNDEQVDLIDSEGNTQTVIERITSDEYHGFAVVFTSGGLEKLNRRSSDSIVVVRFVSMLNRSACIGQVPENMNYPSLYWVNTNTSFRTIRGNEVYDYTYELQLKKNGVADGRNVRFTVRRTDMDIENGDISQTRDKDLTDTVSDRQSYGADDSMRFVREEDGIYHVWGYLPGENADEGDDADAFETSEVGGITYNTVTPSESGYLILKGLDSNDYTFKEIMTEDENNLLKETFTVSLRADDDVQMSLRDGRLVLAYVTSGGQSADITVGAAGISHGQDVNDLIPLNQGIAAMEVENFDAVDLRMGGRGLTAIYIIGSISLVLAAVSLIAIRKKKCANH